MPRVARLSRGTARRHGPRQARLVTMDGATLLLRKRRNDPVRGDPELLHLREERRALEPETYRRAAGPGDDTVRLTQHLADQLPVGAVGGPGARRPRPCGPDPHRRPH